MVKSKMIRLVVSLAVIGGLIGALILGACAEPTSTPTPTPSPPPGEKVYEMRIQTGVPPTGWQWDVWTDYADRLTKASGGRIEAESFSDGTLVPTADTLEAVARGSIECSNAGMQRWNGVMGNITFIGHSVPGGPRNQLEYTNFLYGTPVMDKLKEKYAEQGCRLLAIPASGVETISTNFPIDSVGDYDGKVGRSSGLESEIYAYLGATVGMFPSPEMYTALQTGRVEFVDFAGPGAMWDFKLYEVAEYLAWPPAAGSSACDLFINPDFYDELPNDLQALLESITWATVLEYSRMSYESDSEAVGKWAAYGAKFTGIYDTQEFRDAAAVVYAEMGAEDADFKWAIDLMWEYLAKQAP